MIGFNKDFKEKKTNCIDLKFFRKSKPELLKKSSVTKLPDSGIIRAHEDLKFTIKKSH